MTDQSVLIVGTGVFGISTAYHLLKRGYKNVTLIDRSSILPAPDAASSDINKIVRSDYGDPFWAAMAKEAIIELRKPEWEGLYHETGFLVTSEHERTYAAESYANVQSLCLRSEVLPTQAHIDKQFPKVSPQIPDDQFTYINHEAGWGESTKCVELVMRWCRALGATLVPDQEVTGFIKEGDRIVGVQTKQGKEWRADLIVLAMGAWSEGVLETTELQLPEHLLTAAGQCVAALQLDAEMSKKCADLPVVMDTGCGFYIFPPTAEGEVKCALHKPGYTRCKDGSSVSIPTTTGTEAKEKAPIPAEELAEIRAALRKYYPGLSKLDVSFTRMCWYTDTADSNFLVARHPKHSNIVYATAGSGHGFKFIATIGRYVSDLIEDKLDPIIAKRWAWSSRADHLEGSRTPVPRKDWASARLTEADDLKGTNQGVQTLCNT